jgi:ABC-type polysaccharide/polyol phosphate export permease
MILTCAVFIGLGLTLGALLEETEGFIAIMNLIQLPILFLSSAFFPFDTLKTPVLRQIMFINPFTYAVDGLRSSLIGATTLGPPIHMPDGSILPNSWAPAFPLGVDISVLLVWAIVLWGLGAYLFGKMKVD